MVMNRLTPGQAELRLLDEETCEDLELILTPNCGPFRNTCIPFKIHLSDGAPHIDCLAELFHPNIGRTGNICFNMLGGDAWTEGYSLAHYVVGLLWLLANPNPNSALNSAAAVTEPHRFAKMVERASCGLSIGGNSYTLIRRRREADGLIEVPLDLWLSDLSSQPDTFACADIESLQGLVTRLASIGLCLSEVNDSKWVCTTKDKWSLALTLVDGNLPTELPIDDYCRVYFLQQQAGIRVFGCESFQASIDTLLSANITLWAAPLGPKEDTIPVWFQTIGQSNRHPGRLGADGLSVGLTTFMQLEHSHPATCHDVKWPQESIRLLRQTYVMRIFDPQSAERIVLELTIAPSERRFKAVLNPLTGELNLSPLLLRDLSPEVRRHFGEPLGLKEFGHLFELAHASGVEVEDFTPHQWCSNLFQVTLTAVGTVSASYSTRTNKLTLTDMAMRRLGVGVQDWMEVTKLHDAAELQLLAPGVFQVRAASASNDDCMVWLLSRNNAAAVFLCEPGLSAEAAGRMLPEGEGWTILGEGTVRDLLVSPLVLANECVFSRPTVLLRTTSPSRRALSLGSSLHHFLANVDNTKLRVMNRHLLFRRPAKSQPQIATGPTQGPKVVKSIP
jgi:ubiquitin-protein ligase